MCVRNTLEIQNEWKLIPPKLWAEDESGLVLANKDDIKNGNIPLLMDDWYSGLNDVQTNLWIPYSDIKKSKIKKWDKGMVLFIDDVCISDQIGSRKHITVPHGASTHFFARGMGIYSNVNKLVFHNVSPHTWCGIRNTSLTTVDLKYFTITIQHLAEPGFICTYLEDLTGQSSLKDEIFSWMNCDVNMCLEDKGERLYLAAQAPALTIVMDWIAGRWFISGHKNGQCVLCNQAIYLEDLKGLEYC